MTQLDSVQVSLIQRTKAGRKRKHLMSPAHEMTRLRKGRYSKESERIAQFLITMKKPEDIKGTAFYHWKNKALGYSVLGKDLYKNAGKSIPMRLVVDSSAERRRVISGCHEELGHKGRESTYRRVATRFY